MQHLRHLQLLRHFFVPLCLQEAVSEIKENVSHTVTSAVQTAKDLANKRVINVTLDQVVQVSDRECDIQGMLVVPCQAQRLDTGWLGSGCQHAGPLHSCQASKVVGLGAHAAQATTRCTSELHGSTLRASTFMHRLV